MKYREIFEANKGFHFYRDALSLLIQTHAYGRRLTPEQLSTFVKHINKLIDGLTRRSRGDYSSACPLTQASYKKTTDDVLYKYVSDESLHFISHGSFQFGTAQYYRDSENTKIRDVREGASTFHIGDGNNQFHASVISGFNCAIFCGSSYCAEEDSYMRTQFGKHLVKIKDINAFGSRACKLAGAKDFHVYDVIYNDLKNYMLELDGIDEIHRIFGNRNATRQSLHELNHRFFQIIYDASFMPGLFSKPTAYYREHERRVVLEMPDNIQTPTLVFRDQEMLDLVERV